MLIDNILLGCGGIVLIGIFLWVEFFITIMGAGIISTITDDLISVDDWKEIVAAFLVGNGVFALVLFVLNKFGQLIAGL